MQPKHPELLATADCRGRIFRLSAGGKTLDAGAKATILRALAAGEYVDPITVDALTFQQGADPNRNYSRFTKSALRRMARTFEGMPVLRDHRQSDLTARGGTILESRLVKLNANLDDYDEEDDENDDEDNTVRGLRQRLELVKPWAQAGVLDGTISTFSIGWYPNSADQPLCSICKNSMFSMDCQHYPGDSVETKGGAKKVCEMLWTDADGIETSAVSVPAVLGTRVEGVRTALEAFRAPHRSGPVRVRIDDGFVGSERLGRAIADGVRAASDKLTRAGLNALPELLAAHPSPAGQPTKENPMAYMKLAARLGVAADADEASFLAAVERIVADEKAQRTAAEAALTLAQGELAALRKVEDDKRLERILSECRRKVGQKLDADKKPIRGGTEMEAAVLTLAEVSLDKAEAFVTKLPQIVATGRLSLVEDEPKLVPGGTGAGVELNEYERKYCAQLGIPEEEFLKTKRLGAEQAALAAQKGR